MALSLLWRVPAARSEVAASILQRRLVISRKLSTTTVATQSKMKDWKLWWAKHGANALNAVPDLGKEKAAQLYQDSLGALTALSQKAHSKVKDWKLGRLNHVAIAVPDLKKATQLYKDGLEALTALSRDAHSKAKDWKLGKLTIAVPDLKKVVQLYQDVIGASGSMLSALSQDIQSKAKDGQLNRFAIFLYLELEVDIGDLESLSDADIFVIYLKLELPDRGKLTEAEYKQHIAMHIAAAIGSLACTAIISTMEIPVPVVGDVVGHVVGSKIGKKLYTIVRDLTAIRKS